MQYAPVDTETNRITAAIVSAAVEVHSLLGPGLLESFYEAALSHELALRGFQVQTQVGLPGKYKDLEIGKGYRIDLLVNGRVIVEVKSCDALAPIHEAQVLTYLKLSGLRVGLLLNFNVMLMKEGIRRLVL
jgi:GxxExxY protein